MNEWEWDRKYTRLCFDGEPYNSGNTSGSERKGMQNGYIVYWLVRGQMKIRRVT